MCQRALLLWELISVYGQATEESHNMDAQSVLTVMKLGLQCQCIFMYMHSQVYYIITHLTRAVLLPSNQELMLRISWRYHLNACQFKYDFSIHRILTILPMGNYCKGQYWTALINLIKGVGDMGLDVGRQPQWFLYSIQSVSAVVETFQLAQPLFSAVNHQNSFLLQKERVIEAFVGHFQAILKYHILRKSIFFRSAAVSEFE